MNRSQTLRAAFAAALVGVTGLGEASVNRFVVERHERRLPGLDKPLGAVFATDFHYGPNIRERSVVAWVDAMLEQNADLIVLGGDLVDGYLDGSTGPLVAQLARLRAPLGVWSVWGNHDRIRFDSPRALDAFRTELAAVGVRVLVNGSVRLRDDLRLAGIDDYLQGRPNLAAALADIQGEGATILVSHNPDLLPRVPAVVGLTLAGHTHGGQVCLPGGYPIFTSSRFGRRFAKGWVEGPARGYVSRGLGVSLLPIRFACPAELTVLVLSP